MSVGSIYCLAAIEKGQTDRMVEMTMAPALHTHTHTTRGARARQGAHGCGVCVCAHVVPGVLVPCAVLALCWLVSWFPVCPSSSNIDPVSPGEKIEQAVRRESGHGHVLKSYSSAR